LPDLYVCFLDVFPEGWWEEVCRERFDEYAIIIPYEVEIDLLGDDNAAASSGLKVERGDVSMVGSKGLGEWLAYISY
jgi:hypothetical protein